jgi:hypothetical protein
MKQRKISAKNNEIIFEGTAAIHRQNVEVKTATVKNDDGQNVERKNAACRMEKTPAGTKG